jgi:hypothetical protein
MSLLCILVHNCSFSSALFPVFHACSMAKRKETRSSPLAFGLPIALDWEIAGAASYLSA